MPRCSRALHARGRGAIEGNDREGDKRDSSDTEEEFGVTSLRDDDDNDVGENDGVVIANNI